MRRASEGLPIYSGTESSNPAPSSGESANSRSQHIAKVARAGYSFDFVSAGEGGCSPGARSIGYGLWLLRLQPFEDVLQRLDAYCGIGADFIWSRVSPATP
jgi:hypothetical protein